MFDSKNSKHFLYNSLIKESVQIIPMDIEKIGFGVEVFFNLKNMQPMIISPEDWKDIKSVC
jgi:hypothetical protein